MGIAICIQKAATTTNEAQELISIIQKSKIDKGENESSNNERTSKAIPSYKDWNDPVFIKALAEAGDATKLVNTVDRNGRTPLMWASYSHYNNPQETDKKDKNRIYYVDLLLKVPNIQAKAVDNDGWNALHWSAWSGLTEVTQRFIKEGFDINLPEKNGYTPLMLAAMRGNDAVVEALIKAGADINVKNYKGETAFVLAQKGNIAYQANFDLTKTHVEIKDPNHPESSKEVDLRGEKFKNTVAILQAKAADTTTPTK